MSRKQLKVASFFAGIGGFDLGLERAGMSVKFQCEINKFGQKVLKKHWPKVPLVGDIKNVKPQDIPKDVSKDLTFHFVEHMDEVLSHALAKNILKKKLRA